MKKFSRKKFLLVLLVSPLVALLGACATIVGDNTQLVQLNSSPSGADVSVTDETGTTVFNGKTPTSVTLKKSTGDYWGAKDYTVKVSMAGYKSQTVALTHHANGWYIAGNIAFGGIIGWFIVDPFNGKMYTLSPSQVNASMSPNGSAKNELSPGNIHIALISDVPQSLKDKMVQVK